MSLLHSVLDRDEWSLEDIKEALEQDPFAVDVLNEQRVTPLRRVLNYEEGCSVEVVNLLIHYGADVNHFEGLHLTHKSLIVTALRHCKDAAIIKALIKAGAYLSVQYYYNEVYNSGSVLCHAFRVASMEVIQLLVDSGCPIDDCNLHSSPLHCACFANGYAPKLNYELFEYLFSKRVDVNAVDEYGSSLLCVILSLKDEPTLEDVEMLARQGVCLSSCPRHVSSLICAASGFGIKESVVRRLLEAGADPYQVDKDGNTPLQIIMGECSEIGAIMVLLDLPGVDVNRVDTKKHTLLQSAASNQYNQMSSIVQVLLDRGAKVDVIDDTKSTPLHLALLNHVKDCSIIVKLLLESGAPINARDLWNETPLMVAIQHAKSFDVLMSLFLAGAHVSEIEEYGMHTQRNAFDELNTSDLKLTIMFSLLQNHDVQALIQNRRELSDFLRECVHELQNMESKNVANNFSMRQFVSGGSSLELNECVLELQKMESKNVANQFSMRQFVSGGSSLEMDENPRSKIYDLDQLLQLRPHLEFPNFFNIIVARIGRPAMNEKLKEMKIFTVKQHNDLSNMEKHVGLNYDSTSRIAYYLSDIQLLSLILAFYNLCSRNDNRVTRYAGKRYSEQLDKPTKSLRLSH